MIVTSPLPVADYTSTFSVRGEGQGSTVTWTGTFRPNGATEADATKAIDDIYTTGLDSLKAEF